MTSLDLTTRENWELILTQKSVVTRHSDKLRKDSLYEYDPIQPIYANPRSPLLLIGTKSDNALPHWFLGATASQFLYVSPSTTSYIISGVQAQESKKIGLNRLTLVKFEDYGISPYTLQLSIPYWLEDIVIEVWEYADPIVSANQNIIERLDSIETKIDAIENYGT